MTLESLDIKQQKLQQLQQILPEIFEDGEIIPDKLKDVFGDEVNESREHYSFTWAGKRDCYKTIREKTHATLKVDEEVANDSEIPDGENVFIEGDNLEVLKLLQLSYHKKIKMIYIDPPYNKDKDFVYSDTWGDSIHNYLVQTDQLRDEGYTTTKTNSTGRRHTNWLNMIYPRLWLSRNLLKDDGVIFVSIDDDEVHNLRKVMDEIYGEENFIECITWNKRIPKNDKGIGNIHEYVLIYAKNIDSKPIFTMRKEGLDDIYDLLKELKRKKMSIVKAEKEIKKLYKKNAYDRGITLYNSLDKDYRLWGKINMSWPNANTFGPRYEVLHPITKKPVKIPDRGWRWTEDTFNEASLYKNDKYQNIEKLHDGSYICGKIWFALDENTQPSSVTYLDDVNDFLLRSVISLKSDGGIEVEKLFNEKSNFSYPKPTSLIKALIGSLKLEDNDIILDFFAGSGTTAHAVMDLNQDDKINRKYILIQLPEIIQNKKYKTISDISKARITKAMNALNYKEGFKSFYLDKSNFQVFEEVKKRPDMSYEEIEEMLKMSMFHENILTQGAKELDIVYEVGLKNGFTLSAEVSDVKSEKYSFITLTEDERVFYFCFDKQIEGDIIHDVPKDAKLICYEKALTTNVKLNLRENLDLEVL